MSDVSILRSEQHYRAEVEKRSVAKGAFDRFDDGADEKDVKAFLGGIQSAAFGTHFMKSV